MVLGQLNIRAAVGSDMVFQDLVHNDTTEILAGAKKPSFYPKKLDVDNPREMNVVFEDFGIGTVCYDVILIIEVEEEEESDTTMVAGESKSKAF